MSALEALTKLVESGDSVSLARELLRDRAKVDVDEALVVAVTAGQARCVSVLLEHGAELPESLARHWTLLHLAVEHRASEVVRVLLAAGLDVNVALVGMGTPLHHAVDVAIDGAHQTGEPLDTRDIELLLELGADPRAVDDNGREAIEVARVYQCDEVMALLHRVRGA